MRKLAEGSNIEDLLKGYPHLTQKQIYASLEYVADLIANEESLQSL